MIEGTPAITITLRPRAARAPLPRPGGLRIFRGCASGAFSMDARSRSDRRSFRGSLPHRRGAVVRRPLEPRRHGLIMDGIKPARVADQIIDDLRKRERNGLVQLPKREMFHVGDQVRILQGPFAGHLGLYAGMRAHERVLVLLALLGGRQRVQLPKADVEAVSNTGRAE